MKTLKELAEGGYIMGLSTIGEVALHIELHYDAYWRIEDMKAESTALNILIDGHENDSIDLYLTEEDKRLLDEELEKVMEQSDENEEARQREAQFQQEGETSAGEDGLARDGPRDEGAT